VAVTRLHGRRLDINNAKNNSYSSSAHKVPVNDSALIPFRFIDVQSELSDPRTEEPSPFLSDLQAHSNR
jgi:hypothetical protein